MFDKNKILAVIPARGGSKGLPGKNIADCAGKPLLQWSLEAAAAAAYFERVIVDTDSQEIRQIALACGGDAPFLRPDKLAGDQASLLDAVQHVLHRLSETDRQEYDYVMILQPTSPLRTSQHIDQAIEQYFSRQKHEGDTLVSVYEAEEKNALLLSESEPGYIRFCLSFDHKNPRRQELPRCFFPNGAIFFLNCRYLDDAVYHNHTQYYVMPQALSVDIDSAPDLQRAEAILQQRYAR